MIIKTAISIHSFGYIDYNPKEDTAIQVAHTHDIVLQTITSALSEYDRHTGLSL